MTNEEIYKQLERSANNGVGFHAQVLDYINYLKSEVKRIKRNWNTSVAVQRAFWRKKVEQARKETAKDIIDSIRNLAVSHITDLNYPSKDGIKLANFVVEIKEYLCNKYGVEIDK